MLMLVGARVAKRETRENAGAGASEPRFAPAQDEDSLKPRVGRQPPRAARRRPAAKTERAPQQWRDGKVAIGTTWSSIERMVLRRDESCFSTKILQSFLAVS
ncbi:MAG TPA: hypothetical protein VIA18_01290 [Polyangia bacterium]|nr:hypothetical protein [Polyangia bacterium]